MLVPSTICGHFPPCRLRRREYGAPPSRRLPLFRPALCGHFPPCRLRRREYGAPPSRRLPVFPSNMMAKMERSDRIWEPAGTRALHIPSDDQQQGGKLARLSMAFLMPLVRPALCGHFPPCRLRGREYGAPPSRRHRLRASLSSQQTRNPKKISKNENVSHR